MRVFCEEWEKKLGVKITLSKARGQGQSWAGRWRRTRQWE